MTAASAAQRRIRSKFFLFVVWIVCMLAVLGSLLEVWVIPGLTGGSFMEEQNDIHKKPSPIQCGVEKEEELTTRRPDVRFCEWNSTLRSCREMLMRYVYKQPSWVFLGDTGMAKVADYKNGRLIPIMTSYRNSCRNLAYYGLPPPNQGWIAPNATLGEGPIERGFSSPYCTDCQRCWNVLMEVPTSSENNYMEYLVVEYSRDVSLPTQVSTTTQETAAYYLGRKSPAVCIASAGLNDAAIDPPMSDDVYLKNADKYLGLLQRVCQNVIWIGIPAIVESTQVPQTNCRLKRWNAKMLELIQTRNYKNVFIIDIWKKTMQTDHIGSLGLVEKFYSTLSRLFISLMAGPDIHRF
jgi:hypothetical protein